MAVESLRPRRAPISYAEPSLDFDFLPESDTGKQRNNTEDAEQAKPPPSPLLHLPYAEPDVPSDDNYEVHDVSSDDESDEAFEDARQAPQAATPSTPIRKQQSPDEQQTYDDGSESQRASSSGSRPHGSNIRTQDRIRREGIDWSNPAKNLMIAKLLREAFLSVPNFRLMSHTFEELADVMNRHFPNERVPVNGAAVKYKRDDLRKFYQVLMDLKNMEIAGWDEEKFQVSFTDDQWNIIAHFMMKREAGRPKLPFLTRLRYRDSNPDLKLFKGIYDYKVRQIKKPENAERTLPTAEEVRHAEESLEERPLENFFKRWSKHDKYPSATRVSPKRQRLPAKEEKKLQLEREVDERRQKFEDAALDPDILALQEGVSSEPLTQEQNREEQTSQRNTDDGTHYDAPRNGDVEEPHRHEDTWRRHSNQDSERHHQANAEDAAGDEHDPPAKKRKTVRFVDDGDDDQSNRRRVEEAAPKSILKDVRRQEKAQRKSSFEVRAVELTAEQLLSERESERHEKARRDKEELRERDEIIEQIYLRVEQLYSDRLIGSSLYRQFLAIDALDVFAFLRYKYRLNDRSVAMCVQVLVEISQGEEE